MGEKYPGLYSDDWDVDGRIRDMDEEGVDVQLLVNPGGPVGTRTVPSISSSCRHNIAFWTTSVANTRTDSSR